jgi:hypothetical protein
VTGALHTGQFPFSFSPGSWDLLNSEASMPRQRA